MYILIFTYVYIFHTWTESAILGPVPASFSCGVSLRAEKNVFQREEMMMIIDVIIIGAADSNAESSNQIAGRQETAKGQSNDI